MINNPDNRPIILHIINSLSLGGAELLLNNSLRLLPEFKHIVVYLHEPSEFKVQFEVQGIEVISLNYKRGRNMPLAIFKLNQLIRKRQPALVHSHLFLSTICTRLATPKRVPLVSTIHSVYSKDAFEKNIKSLWAARLTLKKRHSLVAVSDYVLNDYLAHVPFRGKRFVLHNFLPDAAFHQDTRPYPPGKIKMVAVGNLKEAKNYMYLLNIFHRMADLNITLDIYGKGSQEKQLQEYIDRHGLNVRLCGQESNISTKLKHYTHFIQASVHEGFGISVIEAMAARIPVLLSDIPVFREITGELATFFPLSDAEKAATIIKEKVLSGNDKDNTEEAYQYVLNNYSANRYREKLLNIYNEVAERDLSCPAF